MTVSEFSGEDCKFPLARARPGGAPIFVEEANLAKTRTEPGTDLPLTASPFERQPYRNSTSPLRARDMAERRQGTHLSGTGPAQFKLRQRLSKNVTRLELCDAIYKTVGLSRAESAALFELVLKEITDCLEKGETVKLSSFGSFEVREKGARIGRNPKTGKQFPISPRRVVKFKPSPFLKRQLTSNE